MLLSYTLWLSLCLFFPYVFLFKFFCSSSSRYCALGLLFSRQVQFEQLSGCICIQTLCSNYSSISCDSPDSIWFSHRVRHWHSLWVRFALSLFAYRLPGVRKDGFYELESNTCFFFVCASMVELPGFLQSCVWSADGGWWIRRTPCDIRLIWTRGCVAIERDCNNFCKK